MDDFLSVYATGVNVTTGATSASVAIPNASDGNKPRFVRIAATTESYVKLGPVGVTATTGDLLVQPADSVVLMVAANVTNVAYIQGTSTGKVSIVPLENL